MCHPVGYLSSGYRYPALILNNWGECSLSYIEDITRWREDMNFMFEWQEQYLTSKRGSFYYMEKPIQQRQKAEIVTSLNDTTLTKVTYGKYATRVPDEVAYGIYEWFSSQ